MIEKGRVSSISGRLANVTSQDGSLITEVTVPENFNFSTVEHGIVNKVKVGDWVVFARFGDNTGLLLGVW